MFERIIAIDWSGAGLESRANSGLAVAIYQHGKDQVVIQPPTPERPANHVNWRRTQLIDWLATQLAPQQPRTLVLMDFPFSFPYGTIAAWGAGETWHDLVRFVGDRYRNANGAKPARAVAESLNADKGEAFRIHDRCSIKWYLSNGVAYYRATELAVSQALSEFYAGAGAQVALGTLSGLSCLAHLIDLRESGQISFAAWPYETQDGHGVQHILAETYPALFPTGNLRESPHERDARRVVLAAQLALAQGTLTDWFQIPRVPFGRYSGVSFDEQIKLEGWIFGVFSVP